MPADHHNAAFLSLSKHVPRNKQPPSQDVFREQNFTIDLKGDLHNLQYGSSDQYKLSRYRTAGFGRLIGLDRRFRILSTSTSERSIEDEAADSSRKRHGTSLLSLAVLTEKSATNSISHEAVPDEFPHQASYVSLSVGKLQDAEVVTQKGIEESFTDQLDDLPDQDHNSGDDAFEKFRNNPINKKNVELLRAVAQDPQDLQSWMALIRHQQSLFILSSHADEVHASTADKQTVAEIKISYYEKALMSVHALPDKAKLIRGLMKEGRTVWETDYQLKKWNSLLSQVSSPALSVDFVSFQQTTPGLFSYTRCLDVYQKVLAETSKMVEANALLPYIILRLTTFIYQAGFMETSAAIWQAIIDITFFSPMSVEPENSLKSYESYWETECPRIGEDGGKGWDNVEDANVDSRKDELPVKIDEQDLWNGWSKQEAFLSSRQVLPARTMDDTSENDPYRVILFSDIKSFVKSMMGIQGTEQVIQAFLRFCGLPPMQQSQAKVKGAWKDAFLFPTSQKDGRIPLTNFWNDPATLMGPAETCFNCFPKSSLPEPAILEFSTQILGELMDKLPDSDHLAEYNLSLSYAIDPTRARKKAKSLLKRQSDRPRLYNIYALIEVRAGKMEAAEKIWSTAISMATSFRPDLQHQVCLLWENWTWELLANKQTDRVTNLLVKCLPSETKDLKTVAAMSDTATFTEDEVIQAKHYLSDKITTSIQQHDMDSTIAYTNLLAVLTYSLSQYDLAEALRTYASTLASFQPNLDRHLYERMHQYRARLIDLHARTSNRGYRPMQVVTSLRESLTLFPDNSIFHTLFETYSRRAGLVDRLRSIESHLKLNSSLSSDLNNNPNANDIEDDDQQQPVFSTILRISSELSRPLCHGSTPHSVRAAFTSATSATALTRHSPWIWMTWLRWELSLLADHQTSKPKGHTVKSPHIKDIYLSSLRACPWVKDLYLVGFENPALRNVLGDQALDEVYRSMIDRGLRIRIDIEDQVDEKRRQREVHSSTTRIN